MFALPSDCPSLHCAQILPFFETLGFKCPKRKGAADFLQEVTSRKDQAQYWCALDLQLACSHVPLAPRARLWSAATGKGVDYVGQWPAHDMTFACPAAGPATSRTAMCLLRQWRRRLRKAPRVSGGHRSYRCRMIVPCRTTTRWCAMRLQQMDLCTSFAGAGTCEHVTMLALVRHQSTNQDG